MTATQTDTRIEQRLRELCLSFPEAIEKEAWGAPTYRVGRIFAMQSGDEGRIDVWCKARPMVQEMLVASDPDRYFAPPYVGPNGWIGIHLTFDVDWDDVEDWIAESYRLVAPKRLVTALDGNGR
jgi:hypothetical protein